jgi:hypothetical protein
MRVAQLALRVKLQRSRGRCRVQLPPPARLLTRRIHRDAALQMALARLILGIELHVASGRAQMAAGRGGQREAVQRIQPFRRSIVAEENLRLARRRPPPL